MSKAPKLLRRGLIATALALVALSAAPAGADEHEHGERDHDRARHARERGEVLPLEKILAVVRARIPGDVVGVELEREHGVWIYEVRVIDRNGRRLVVRVDGAKATILEIEGE